MTGIISGIKSGDRGKVSFIVLLGDADGGLIEIPKADFTRMARKANREFTDLKEFNGSKCSVKLLSDNRIISVTEIR